MKKQITILLSFLFLAGCTVPAAESPEPVGESSAPVVSVPETELMAGVFFTELPVTEEALRRYYTCGKEVAREETWEYSYNVVNIMPFEEDYLVEYTSFDSTTGLGVPTMLDWVFGETGRVVRLTEMEYWNSYTIEGRGMVSVETSGKDPNVDWQGLPEKYEVTVPGGGKDCLGMDMSQGVFCYTTQPDSWANPRELHRIGVWDGEELGSERREQLYDARVDVDGLSFSFVPDSTSLESFMSFFPAYTTIPSLETYTTEEGIFTLRLYHTTLTGEEYTREMEEWLPNEYAGIYPNEIPEGSLGRDNHFLTDVEIRQDGEDVVVTARLTEKAGKFTVECDNFGEDNIPCLRLVFREQSYL